MLSPDRQLAVFDLENTLVATNVVDSYAWFATRRMDIPERARFTVRTLLEAPRMLSLDMVDRGDFLRWFYRRYEDADLATLRTDSWSSPATCSWPSRSRPGSAVSGSTAPSATGPCSSPVPSTSSSSRSAPCSTTSSAPIWATTAGS